MTSLAAMSLFFVLAPAVDRRRQAWRSACTCRSVLTVRSKASRALACSSAISATIGRMPQAQRLFAYHGAEHRAIQAYEAGEPLEVESLEHFPNAHVRCGTSFLLTSTVLSSLVFGALGPQSFRARLLTRLALMPVDRRSELRGDPAGQLEGQRDLAAHLPPEHATPGAHHARPRPRTDGSRAGRRPRRARPPRSVGVARAATEEARAFQESRVRWFEAA